MRKKAIIILADGFEEIEACMPIDVLRRAGINVTIAGLGGDLIIGAHAISVKTDKELQETDTDYDICILPGGGSGAKNLALSKLVKSLLLKFNSAGKIIAAICASPAVVLAPLGFLDNKKATCYPGTEDKSNDKIEYKNEKVVIDGNIITSQGPGTAAEFSLKIIEQLLDKETAEKLKENMLFNL